MPRAKIYVTCKPADAWHRDELTIDKFQYEMWSFDMGSVHGHTAVTSFEIDFEFPAGFDPRSGAVKELEDEKTRITAEFQNKITAIQSQINRFTALEVA